MPGAGRGACGCRAGLAAAQPGRHRDDHRRGTVEELGADLARCRGCHGEVKERLDRIWPGPGGFQVVDLVRGRRRRCYAGSWSGPSRKVFPPARASIVTPVD